MLFKIAIDHNCLLNYIAQLSGKLTPYQAGKTNLKYISLNIFQDGQGRLYQVNSHNPAIIAKYRLLHQDSQGSVIVILEHKPTVQPQLTNAILAQNKTELSSNLEEIFPSNSYSYTHRLKIIRIKNKHLSCQYIDIKIGQNTYYNSIFLQKVIKYVLDYFLKQSLTIFANRDYLDLLFQQNWLKQIEDTIAKFEINYNLKLQTIDSRTSNNFLFLNQIVSSQTQKFTIYLQKKERV